MSYDEGQVKDVIQTVVKEMGLARQVSQVVYRSDYQDYRVFLDGTHHCPIREKLIHVFLENKEEEDVRREIEFLLSHPSELEEWEREEEETQGGDYKNDVSVDNSADYDF